MLRPNKLFESTCETHAAQQWALADSRSMVSKVQERIFAEEAAKLLDAQWEIVGIPEPPDFEVRAGGETLGLEVRQIFIDGERSYGSHMKKDESKCQKYWGSIAKRYYGVGGEPLHVKALGPLPDNDIDEVVRELVRHRPVYLGPESLLHDTQLYIGGTKLFLKALPASFEGYSRWISINDHVGWVPPDERIRLVEDVWDSIAADQSLLR